MIAAIAIIAIMASITGTNAFFCNQLVNVAGITAGIVANKKVPIQNTTIMNFTAVSNYTVCYSATVKVALTYSDPSSVTVWDMGGFPYVNATSSTQIIASNPNIMSCVVHPLSRAARVWACAALATTATASFISHLRPPLLSLLSFSSFPWSLQSALVFNAGKHFTHAITDVDAVS